MSLSLSNGVLNRSSMQYIVKSEAKGVRQSWLMLENQISVGVFFVLSHKLGFKMDPLYLLRIFLFSQLLLLLLAGVGIGKQGKCSSSFSCGSLGALYFPFTTTEHQHCGLLAIQGCDERSSSKMIQLRKDGRSFQVIQVLKQKNRIIIFDKNFHKLLLSKSCEVFNNNFTLPLTSPMASFSIGNIRRFYKCDRTVNVSNSSWSANFSCSHYEIYKSHHLNFVGNSTLASKCSMLQLPGNDWHGPQRQQKQRRDLFSHLSANISIEVNLTDKCYSCHYQSGGLCRLDEKGSFYCAKETSSVLKLGLGLGAGILCILIIIGCSVILWRYKWNYTPSHGQARNTYSDPCSNPDPESDCVYFGVPLFSYKELREATNNFDLARELGEGGFGTVYYGKLQDGREVAVKRLYEHNFRRVKLFMNEVEILTRLRHKNLVSLYGCTSCQSRELLLVYEYIPNGTVASHLHGNLGKCKLLPWALRMKIATETASALVYLHASDIIHRDVKTNNILLDNNYCVKVADFGLSRLFPNNVTHVSTAPQGTPGYVDPEYHRCYQLTSKSDVYSFGVVLIELISSMPAVDLTRDKDEINLADLAMRKIGKGVFNELVDPSLGFELDSRRKRMIDAVVELAFQCLQWDSESRPSMEKVLEVLKRIVSERDECEHEEELDVHGAENSHSNTNIHPQSSNSQDRDEDGLLKNMKLSSSPNMVTHKWEYELSTPNKSV